MSKQARSGQQELPALNRPGSSLLSNLISVTNETVRNVAGLQAHSTELCTLLKEILKRQAHHRQVEDGLNSSRDRQESYLVSNISPKTERWQPVQKSDQYPVSTNNRSTEYQQGQVGSPTNYFQSTTAAQGLRFGLTKTRFKPPSQISPIFVKVDFQKKILQPELHPTPPPPGQKPKSSSFSHVLRTTSDTPRLTHPHETPNSKHNLTVAEEDHHERDQHSGQKTKKQHESSHSIGQSNKVNLRMPSQMAVVEFNLQQFILPFKAPPFESLSQAKTAVSHWLADLYHQLCHETFRGYFSRHLTDSEYRQFFTHSLSLNFEQMTRHFYREQLWLWKLHRTEIIEHFEQESMRCILFMQVKYPLKRKTFVSEEGRQALPVIDLSSELEFDVMYATETVFQYDENQRSYERQVKVFLNKLVEEAVNHYPLFRKLIKEMFTLTKEGTSKVLKNKIGMKFRENMPTYSKEEIAKQGINIKVPQTLRIVVKWVEELQKRVAGLVEGTLLGGAFRRKSDKLDSEGKHHLNNNFLKKAEKNKMTELLEKFNNTRQAQLELKRRIQSLMGMIPEFVDRYQPHFPFLKDSAVRNGLLNFALAEVVANLTTKYLVFLIHFLERLAMELGKFNKSSNPDSEAVEEGEFEFVRFSVGDLLRCKCSGTLKEIKQVFAKLSSHPNFTVYRIKNRLETSNRDFLVNVKFKNTPLLCEIQLAVTDSASSEEKELYLDHFSHFLYELSRAKYGPVGEAVVINTSLTEIAGFFEQSIRKIEIPHVSNEELWLDVKLDYSSKEMSIKGYTMRSNIFSFVCTRCLEFKKAHHSYYGHVDSKTSAMACESPKIVSERRSETIVCGQCVYTLLSPEHRTFFLLGCDLSEFFEFADWGTNPTYLCIMKQKAAAAQPSLMVSLGDESYVPVFYRAEKSAPIPIVKSEVVEKYHCLTFKKNVRLVTVELKQLLTAIKDDTSNAVLLEGLSSLKPFEYQGGSEDPLGNQLLKQERLLVQIGSRNPREFLSELIYLESFEETPHSIMLAISNTSRHCLLVDLAYPLAELLGHIPRGRPFNSLEAKIISRNSIWEFSSRGLGDRSFMQLGKQNQFDNVEEIDLSDNVINASFASIKSRSLQVLNLNNNSVRRFGLGPTAMPRLIKLDLTGNHVTRIEQAEHPALEILLLGNNLLKQVEIDTWKLLNLHTLNLKGNKLPELDFSRTQPPLQLKYLNISACELKRLVLPKNLSILEELILEQNELTEVGFNDQALSKLHVLRLSKNKLSKLQLPQNLSELEVLGLSGNDELVGLQGGALTVPLLKFLSISNIPLEGVLASAPLMAELVIEGCTLQILTFPTNEKIMEVCPRLNSLLIVNCTTKQIDLSQLNSETVLKKLSITSNNAMQTFKPPIKSATLNQFQLSNNNILQEFDCSGCQWSALSAMDVINNGLVKFKIYPTAESIVSLNLSNNKLYQLDLRQCKFDSLTSMDLSNNKLGEVLFPKVLPALKTLNISRNSLQQFDISEPELPSLVELDLKVNSLVNINVNNPTFAKLESLDLSWNRLPRLYLVGLTLPELKNLRLSHNLLVEYVVYKVDLPNLRIASFDHNSLKLLDLQWLSFPRIQKIDLSYNLLNEILLKQSEAMLPDLVEVDLRGNPERQNIQIAPSKLTPKLKPVETGIHYTNDLVMWMLEQTPQQTRKQYYGKVGEVEWNPIEKLFQSDSLRGTEDWSVPEEIQPQMEKLLNVILSSTGIYECFQRRPSAEQKEE